MERQLLKRVGYKNMVMSIQLELYIDHTLVEAFNFESITTKSITIGRNQDNDINISSTIISSRHAKITFENDEFCITDLNSTNGIWINEERVTKIALKSDSYIYFSNPNKEEHQGDFLAIKISNQDRATNWREIPLHLNQEIMIGRKNTNDIVIPHSLVSREHAMISIEENTVEITDLNSTNGTFVNGQRIKDKVMLQTSDKVYIGQATFVLSEDKLKYDFHEDGLRLDAIQISKEVIDSSKGLFGERKTKKILDDINIQVKPGELVALVGGSGAGKSTLMDALNCFRPATTGKVLINDDDFYHNYEAYKSILGYVPQQDIVYDTLTVEEMLTYAAKLRMPEDSTNEEISNRVREVINDVELHDRENVVISQLSGGQRKRTSIAVELLADPKLFFLDEPTSGLDPGMERHMMQLLRKLSNQGKTVILITHATANLHLCNKVIYLGKGGNLCYYGPPNECYNFFDTNDYADIYNLIDKDASYWAEKFASSELASYQHDLVNKKPEHKKIKNNNGHSLWKQFQILSSRYAKLILSDKQKTLFLLAQAPIIALLLGVVSEKNAFEYYESAKEVIFTTASAAVWIGMLNSIQEIAKENTIYKRERAVNLKLLPYIMSKIFVLGVLGLIQTLLFTLFFLFLIDLPSANLIGSLPIEIMVTFFLTIMTATAFGLLISSLFSNPDQAMGLAPMLLIPQLIFNGLVFKLEGLTEFISYFIISKWTARALSISFDLNNLPMEIETKIAVPPRDLPEYYDHDLSLLIQNWETLIIFSVICLFGGVFILNRKKEH